MLLSKIGEAYDPVTNKGTTGRNYAYQTANNVTLFFDDKNFNPFIGAGAVGMGIDEFNNDNFDHSGLGFSAVAASASRRSAPRLSVIVRCRPARRSGDRNGSAR